MSNTDTPDPARASQHMTFDSLPERGLRTLGLSGALFKSAINFSKKLAFEPPVELRGKTHASLPLEVGAFTYFRGDMLRAVKIGRYCSLAPHVQIGATEHPTGGLSTSVLMYAPNYADFEAFHNRFSGRSERRKASNRDERVPLTTIGNDVWIGHGAFIRAGVTIGDGAIVGAHAVVTKDVAPYSIVAGVPATVKKMRFPDAVIARLLASRWWRYPLHDILAGPAADPMRCLDWIDEQVAAGSLRPYEPEWITAANIRDKLQAPGGVADDVRIDETDD